MRDDKLACLPWRALAAASALAIAAFAAFEAPADPVLEKPTDGYVYFHRAGSDMAAHDAAVEDCVQRAGSAATPSSGGIVGAVMIGRFNDYLYRANIENCMVAQGWDVVRLDPDEGKRLNALSPADQHAALAAWVGATTVHGDLARHYEPLPAMLRRLRYDTGPMPASPPLPLSLTAGDHRLQRHSPPGAAHQIQPRGPDATVGAGDAVIVVRLVSHDPRQRLGLMFGRLDDPQGADASHGYDYVWAQGHAKMSLTSVGPAVDTTFVIPVKPGRWRLMGAQDLVAVMGGNSVSLCVGGPAFDVASGAAVFAGTFDAAADDSLAPDLSLTPVAATLRDPALVQRLMPAGWRNDPPIPCGLAGGIYIYGYAMPGAPTATR